MNNVQLHVDLDRPIGKIRAMHGVGQPPWERPHGIALHYLTEANIPYSRLHDVAYPYGSMIYVDIPNIFRDFDADENDPASYDFAFTDILISRLIESGVEPIYRLGATIENFVEIKRYHTFVPRDFGKWARICEHIVRHYTEGWADGFTHKITYWEIWNEPENNIVDPPRNPMWSGTAEEYYEMYAVAAKHLKACFGDKIKVGGYASCGLHAVLLEPRRYGIDAEPLSSEPAFRSPRYQAFVQFFYDFLAYIKREDAPLDFFSWHSYLNTDLTVFMERFVEKTLDEHGYGDAEIHLNEWNNANQFSQKGSSFASSRAAAMMCCMHKTNAHMLCYYDAQIGCSRYGGLFDPMTYRPVSTYYSFKAFGELYALGNEIACACGDLPALAAVSEDGERCAVMIANTGEDVTVQGIPADMRAYIVDETHFLTETNVTNGAIDLPRDTVALLKNFKRWII